MLMLLAPANRLPSDGVGAAQGGPAARNARVVLAAGSVSDARGMRLLRACSGSATWPRRARISSSSTWKAKVCGGVGPETGVPGWAVRLMVRAAARRVCSCATQRSRWS
jgi:hypothetical protein